MKILFSKSKGNIKFILNSLGKKIDSEGFIVDLSTGSRVLSPDGEFVKWHEFGGIKKGSEIFIKSDVGSLLNYVHRYVHA